MIAQSLSLPSANANGVHPKALRLYKKYAQFQSEGRLNEVLEEIYEEGRHLGFKPPTNATVTTDGMGPSVTTGTKMVVAGVHVTELPP